MLYQLSYGHHELEQSHRAELLRFHKARGRTAPKAVGKLVGVERFELPTSCSQSRRATRLRYTPNNIVSFKGLHPEKSSASY